MKIIALVLLILLAWLQYKIWLQDGGIPEVLQLEDEVADLQQDVSALKERNASLDAEVQDLKKGLDAIEERARNEMGMIREGETYYQVVDRHDDDRDKQPEQAEVGQQDAPAQAGKASVEQSSTQPAGAEEMQADVDADADAGENTQIDIRDNLIKR